MFYSFRFVLLPLATVEKNLATKMQTCEEKIKSIEVHCFVINVSLH